MVFVELNIEMSKHSTKVSSFFKCSFSIIKKKETCTFARYSINLNLSLAEFDNFGIKEGVFRREYFRLSGV